MDAANHTPAPWHVHRTRTHFHIRSATHEIALVRNVGNAEADAALIAEAPLLLELVEQCFAKAPITGDEWTARAREIVNRARSV